MFKNTTEFHWYRNDDGTFRITSSVSFIEDYFGIKLTWYQKLLLSLWDFRDRQIKRFFPLYYYFRFQR